MRKILVYFILIISLFVGCSTESSNLNILKAPENNNLFIKGTWIDEDNENNKIYFDLDSAYVYDRLYKDTKYRLKIVKPDYIISYEKNIRISDYISSEKEFELYSIMSKDKLVCEVILIEKNKAILTYNDNTILINKISEDINEFIKIEKEKTDSNNNPIYENSTGVMIGLKSKIDNKSTYRTLWIPYYNKRLATIYELKDITFPMRDGIYKIKAKTTMVNGHKVDEFELITPDKKNIVLPITNVKNDIYRSITFLCNDFIGIEEITSIEGKEELKLKLLPVKRLNSLYGLSIDEIYGKEVNEEFKKDIISAGVSLEEIDYTDYTLYRENGKWNIYSKIDTETGEDLVKLSIKPNNKMVTYDTLTIPWKTLKSEFPIMKDAFISPAEDIAIIVLEDSMGIYEIKDGQIEDSPLFNIPISKNEEVIMAEWSTGFYTKYWEKSFLSGRAIN